MSVRVGALEISQAVKNGRWARVREWWEQEHVFGYGLIAPAFVLIACLVAYPFAMAIYFSLSDYWVGSPGGFVGLANFREIFANEVFLQTVRNSFLFTAIALTCKAVLGVQWMFDSLYSVVNWTAIRSGLISAPGPNWLGMSGYAMAAVITVNVWRGLPFFAITVLAGLVSIPREYYEAAEVDGASSFARFG